MILTQARIVLALVCASLTASASCAAAETQPATEAVEVRIAKVDGRYRVLRDGEVFEIKGAGLGGGRMESLASHGGTAFRTWRTGSSQMTGQEILDRAHELGLMVAMGIAIARERHGFDYDDKQAVAEQLEYARSEVLKYKDHPALLAWIIGNELNLEAKNPRYMNAINDLSLMIHEVDGQHPTTTTLAGFNRKLADLVRERAPDLDFISIQKYGDIVNLPKYLEQANWDRPYWVTEWGSVGHWEVSKTAWGAPIEENSSEKAASYRRAWDVALASDPRMMGSFVFLWGQKQERTPTWYGMFLQDGSKTEVVDVMHQLWNGSWPENRAPHVNTLFLDGKTANESITLAPGAEAVAHIGAVDPDDDALRFSWEIMRESTATQTGGDREETPEIMAKTVVAGEAGEATVTAPEKPGPYRLFVYIFDGHGHAGHANVPFYVNE